MKYKIYEEREKQGISGAELARLAGISQSTVNRIENGRIDQPRFEQIARIARALNISIYDLFEWEKKDNI